MDWSLTFFVFAHTLDTKRELKPTEELFSAKNLLILFDTACRIDFSEADQEDKGLWKVYTMEILPCTHGRGAHNFWRQLQHLNLTNQPTDLKTMVGPTEQGLALATIENKREEVLAPKPKRKPGAPRRSDQNPVLEERYTYYHLEVLRRQKNMKDSWLQEFDRWAKTHIKSGFGEITRDAEQQQQFVDEINANTTIDEARMNRILSALE